MASRDTPPVGAQLGLPSHRYFILCGACAARVEGDYEFLLAMFGPQGVTDEDSILLCVPWDARTRLIPSRRFKCDGCHTALAVASSSDWFVREWAKERAT